MEDFIKINNDEILQHIEKLSDNGSNIFKSCKQQDFLTCYIFYLEDKQLINYKKYEIQINNNKITKNELMTLHLNNQKLHNKEFGLTGIYKYELNIKENKIRHFCENSADYNFLSEYTSIEDIYFNPSIEMFSDNNSIMLFYSKVNKNGILKNTFEEKSEIHRTSNNKTHKKVRFQKNKQHSNNHNKTIRKTT